MASMIRTGKTVNHMVEEVLSKCTVLTFLCLTLAFFKFSINFSIIMGTSVQKNFFLDLSELFIDELFNKCFHLQENAKKIFK